MPTPDKLLSNYSSTGFESEDESGDESEDNIPTINDVTSLKKGVIKTSKNKVQAPYTILLVGETGVGKSAFLQFVANVLIGNNILDCANEEGGSEAQSQTNSARLYEITSTNGIGVRILDTPGLADTRGIERDEGHKKNIVTEIQKHIDSVNIVLILANGTVPRTTVSTGYVLSTLSAIFPKSLANNIAFVFTNVAGPLSCNFSPTTIPEVLRDAPQFHIDNPIALQRRYISLQSERKMKKMKKDWLNAVHEGEQKALETLVHLFDRLDGLEPQPTNEIVYLYNLSQTIEAMITNTLSQMDQAAAKKMEIDKLIVELKVNSNGMNVIRSFKNTVTMVVWKLQNSPTNNMVCGQGNCYSNCEINYTANIALDLKGRFRGSCDKCNHSLWHHHRCHAKWEQVVDTQVLIDQDLKKKWETAKDEKGKTAVLVTFREKVLHKLDEVINGGIGDLARLVERYSDLALSGGFLAQVDKTVNLLEQHYIALKARSIDEGQLQKVEESLGGMRKKLELLTNAKEIAQKEVERVGIRAHVKKWFRL